MNIFITVGTTPFDKLIALCDRALNVDEHNVKAQISNLAEYVPANFESFAYTGDILDCYNWADVVVAHAGSGTLFQLLEMNKKTIFVPNNIHKDAHQNDLCRYVQNNNFAFVLNEYEEINSLIDRIAEYDFNLYRKENSNIAEFVVELICAGR